MLGEIIRLIGLWILVASLAHLFHLFGGCLSVGPAEVKEQVIDYYDNPIQYGIFILTAGMVQIE
jgi:hypothetical protein